MGTFHDTSIAGPRARRRPGACPTTALVICSMVLLPAAFADDSAHLLRVDHYVKVKSTVPAIAGQTTQIYVREVVQAGAVLRGGPAADRVVVFIHGAGTPAEVAFDVPFQDY